MLRFAPSVDPRLCQDSHLRRAPSRGQHQLVSIDDLAFRPFITKKITLTVYYLIRLISLSVIGYLIVELLASYF